MKKLLCSLFALSAVSTAMAQEVNIKLLGTSDIHGRVVPWSYGADVEDKSGSYAQIATYVKDVRKNNKNVVLVDVGDAIQDNQVDVFAKDKKYYKDHPIPKVLNEMNYDIFVLGNHHNRIYETHNDGKVRSKMPENYSGESIADIILF